MKEFVFFIAISIYIKYYECLFMQYVKSPEINETGVNMTSHLELRVIKNICKNRDLFCKVKRKELCAMRKVDENVEYKDFKHSCYVFLANMCDYPGEEFAILTSHNCDHYLQTRRQAEENEPNQTEMEFLTTTENDADGTTRAALREYSFSTLYEIEQAFDRHICPMSCPNDYKPICINVNRGTGKHLKYFVFVNHCEGDKYYCLNFDEFYPPEGYNPNIQNSPLSWSYCAASRYQQFARFAESTSSMGYHGWLDGDQRYSKILEPWERKPGYG